MSREIELSIIIPTKDEEAYLPLLLRDIEKQENPLPRLEVIVADAHSADRTREIALQHKARIVDGGMPAIGRNKGAKVAKGDTLLFLDADVRLTPDFLKDTYYEFLKKGCGTATVNNDPLDKKYLLHYICYNGFVYLTQKFKPHATGTCIYAKKNVFDFIGGFRPELSYAEDSEFVERAKKRGFKFGLLNGSKVHVSTRRLKRAGVKTSIQIIKATAYRFTGKEITEDIGYDLDTRYSTYVR